MHHRRASPNVEMKRWKRSATRRASFARSADGRPRWSGATRHPCNCRNSTGALHRFAEARRARRRCRCKACSAPAIQRDQRRLSDRSSRHAPWLMTDTLGGSIVGDALQAAAIRRALPCNKKTIAIVSKRLQLSGRRSPGERGAIRPVDPDEGKKLAQSSSSRIAANGSRCRARDQK
jgi:hypothetical protein